MDNIEKKIKEIIAEKLNINIDEIKPATSIADDLGADSLDIVELFMSMEDEFSIEVKEDDAEKLITVQNIIDYIESNT